MTLLISLAVAGCGPKGIPTNYVEGIVTFDGQSLEGALVTFIPVAADGRVASGYADATGKYTLTTDGGAPQKGALEGDYKVTVSKMDIKEVPRLSSGPSPASNSQYSQPEMDAVQTLMTPKVYSVANDTPLKATVKKGKNDIPLEMTNIK